tara:strand:+ start:383 stop:688 length:306 start_codon:yes stop_codon:yes gene_type:complete
MSRYKTENQIRRDKQGRRYFVPKMPPSIPTDDSDDFVVNTSGVGLSALAKEHYDDETLWWVIARANGVGKKGFGIDASKEVIRIPNKNRLPQILADAGASY